MNLNSALETENKRCQLPPDFLRACRRSGAKLTRFVLVVNVREQRMHVFERAPAHEHVRGGTASFALATHSFYRLRRRCIISTSRFGVGQEEGSNKTPLGLHRVAEKIGAGWPIGAVFRARKMIGFTWQGWPTATIAHRILWLEGLEPGFNRGGNVDSHSRYIYIHGLADEPTLGRPASHGCIHVAGSDLLPLFDGIPNGTLVWIVKG